MPVRRRRLRRIFLLVLLGLLLLAAVLHVRVNPLVQELAQAKITDAASGVINRAVNQQIQQGDIQYENLVTLQRDNEGNITALTTNMREMNRLKTELLTLLDDEIYSIEDDAISIPVGDLTGIQLLGGRGPEIPVKIVAVSSSDADFQGEFLDAGINQNHPSDHDGRILGADHPAAFRHSSRIGLPRRSALRRRCFWGRYPTAMPIWPLGKPM